jgi:hypothetical protein
VWQDLEWTFSGFRKFRFRDLGIREVELHDIVTPEIVKRENSKISGKVSQEFGILGFEGQRGKTLNHKISKIVKFGILKRKKEKS